MGLSCRDQLRLQAVRPLRSCKMHLSETLCARWSHSHSRLLLYFLIAPRQLFTSPFSPRPFGLVSQQAATDQPSPSPEPCVQRFGRRHVSGVRFEASRTSGCRHVGSRQVMTVRVQCANCTNCTLSKTDVCRPTCLLESCCVNSGSFRNFPICI